MLFYLYTAYLINLQPAGELNGCRSSAMADMKLI